MQTAAAIDASDDEALHSESLDVRNSTFSTATLQALEKNGQKGVKPKHRKNTVFDA